MGFPLRWETDLQTDDCASTLLPLPLLLQPDEKLPRMDENCIQGARRDEAMPENLAPGVHQQDNEAFHVRLK